MLSIEMMSIDMSVDMIIDISIEMNVEIIVEVSGDNRNNQIISDT